jgi:hypothetical protein
MRPLLIQRQTLAASAMLLPFDGMPAGAMDLQSLARLLQAGQATGLAALRVALPAPDLPPDPQVELLAE